MFSLKGKTALITGAGGGIGSEIAIALCKAGAEVALCDINLEAITKLKNDLGETAHVFELNMMDTASFEGIVANIAKINGHIDILVNCAGINKREGMIHVEESTYDRIMNINLKGAFFLSQTVVKYMKSQKSGSIINIGSHNTGPVLGGVSVYGMSKSAILSLTQSQSVEWAHDGIRSNCVSPGHIKTELTTATWEHPERSKYLLDRIAMNRPGKPEDIAGACVFLASDASSYISGTEIRIDGACVSGGQPWPLEGGY